MTILTWMIYVTNLLLLEHQTFLYMGIVYRVWSVLCKNQRDWYNRVRVPVRGPVPVRVLVRVTAMTSSVLRLQSMPVSLSGWQHSLILPWMILTISSSHGYTFLPLAFVSLSQRLMLSQATWKHTQTTHKVMRGDWRTSETPQPATHSWFATYCTELSLRTWLTFMYCTESDAVSPKFWENCHTG